MIKRIKPLEPPDTHHLSAAQGWLELGKPKWPSGCNWSSEKSPLTKPKKARLALSNDLNQKTKEVADLQEILKQKDEKLTEAQKVQAELLKQRREAASQSLHCAVARSKGVREFPFHSVRRL